MANSHSLSGLPGLPLDILVDSILPGLSTSSLNALAQTSHDFHRLVDGPDGEIVWRRKAEQDFHFPVNNTGRRTGWRELYQRLLKQSAQNSNGRLGISPDDTQSRRHLIQGGLPLPKRLPLSFTLVGLEAGGFSFHALTSKGSIISWGTMDGENWTRGGALSHVGVCAHEPFELPATRDGKMGEVVQLEAGRKHVVTRNTKGEVWEYRSFGRAHRVVDTNNAWGPTSSDPVVAVEAGWHHSVVLSAAGSVFVWWEQGSAPQSRLAAEAGESSLSDVSTQGVTFNLPIETTRLPSLPIPRHKGTISQVPPSDKITSIASGLDFVIALTSSAKLYYLNISPVDIPNQPLTRHAGDDADDSPDRGRASIARLEAAFVSGERKWELMSNFCEMEKVAVLPVWEMEGRVKPKLETRITAVSAHFHSFVAYSVPTSRDSGDSIVLMGDDTWTPESVPSTIPELQGKDVIKVVQGDYHYIALTASGHLYSWGAYSAGALGLGHPQLSNTPLSAPHPPSAPF
ncbi:SCF-associated factor 1, partial [Phenoliferia sp. Uapishka_3]